MRKSVLLGLASIIAISALFVACGGGDDKSGTSNQPDGNGGGGSLQNLQVSKGLTVANLSPGDQSKTGNEGADSGTGSVAGGSGASGVGAPSADRSASGYGGTGGGMGGDSTGQQATTTDNTGITVQGYGSASADADSAIVEFSFSNNGGGVIPAPAPSSPGTGSAEPITREKLQPVIDALTGAGVSNDDIELLSQSYYYDAYYSSATLRATIKDLGILDSAVQAAQSAAAGTRGVTLNATNVIYTLQNSEALERAAAQAAVEDAADRATVLADVLKVNLGSVSGASDYSWYGSGTGCGHDYYSPWPIAYSPWRIGGSADGTVQVVSNISVTYAFS